MSHYKSSSIAVAAVLAIMAVPFSYQLVEGNQIRKDLQSIEDQRASQEAATSDGRRVTQRGERKSYSRRSAKSLLESLSEAANNRLLIRAMITGDRLDKAAARARIAEMTPEEIASLFEEVNRFPLDGFLKVGMLRTVEKLAPDQSPKGRLERLVSSGVQYEWGLMRKWASNEPDAALSWYREKRASGDLLPGFSENVHQGLIGELISGLASSSPTEALDLYRSVPRSELNGAVPVWIGSAFARNIMESGDESSLVQVLDFHNGEAGREDRRQVLVGAFGEYARIGRFDEGMALVVRHDSNSSDRDHYVESLFRHSLALDQLGGGMDWVIGRTAEAENPETVTRAIDAFARRDRIEAQEWAESQPPGTVRDATHAAVADRASNNSDYRGAVNNLENISDPALRAETLQLIQERWRNEDRESVRRNLPADLREQLENQ